MTAKELYLYALDEAADVVSLVRPGQLNLPTPDTEWCVRDLLQHILYELAWTTDIVAGKTIADVGEKYEGDLLGDNLQQAWSRYEALARDAVEACDERGVSHLSYADKTVEEYLLEAGNDQLVHAWDLGEAIGVKVVFDQAVAQMLYDKSVARQEELVGSGLFAAPVNVPKNASIQTKLLAILGRSADWRQRLPG